jgi:hypothetical protein
VKVLIIKFEDSVDVSALPVGAKEITVSDGVNTIKSGVVIAKTDAINPDEPALVQHTHALNGTSSGTVTGISGPAVP